MPSKLLSTDITTSVLGFVGNYNWCFGLLSIVKTAASNPQMSGMYTFFRMFFNVHYVFVWKRMKEINLLSYGTWKVAALWWLMYIMWWQHRGSKRNNSFTEDDIPQWWKNLACFTRQKHEEGENLTNNERKKNAFLSLTSCGKVIFSQESVCHSVQEGSMWPLPMMHWTSPYRDPHPASPVILFRGVPCDHYP